MHILCRCETLRALRFKSSCAFLNGPHHRVRSTCQNSEVRVAWSARSRINCWLMGWVVDNPLRVTCNVWPPMSTMVSWPTGQMAALISWGIWPPHYHPHCPVWPFDPRVTGQWPGPASIGDDTGQFIAWTTFIWGCVKVSMAKYQEIWNKPATHDGNGPW